MSGLQSYMGKVHSKNERVPTPPPAQPSNRLNLEAVQGLKFSMSKPRVAPPVPAPIPASQKLASTTPNSGYYPNDSALRNTYPNSRFTKENHHERGFDEVTVASDFDQTKSDIDFVQEDEDDEVDRQGMTGKFAAQDDHPYQQSRMQPKLHHVAGQSPLNATTEASHIQSQTHGKIHNRFTGIVEHPDLQHRPGQNLPSKKRNRSIGNGRIRSSSEEDYEEDEHENELPGPHYRPRLPSSPPLLKTAGKDLYTQTRGHEKQVFEASSDGGGTVTPVESPSQRKSRGVDRHQSSQALIAPIAGDNGRPMVDYTDEQLKKMKYSDLKASGWDNAPNSQPFDNFPPELRGPNVDVAQIVDFLINHGEDIFSDGRTSFIEELSINKWEDVGDWLIEKFADVLKQYKAQRQQKRAITERYEAEIEAREKAVRAKSDLFDKKKSDMQASGQAVLRGEMV